MPTKREIEYMMDFEGDPFMDGYRRGYQEGLKDGAKLYYEPTGIRGTSRKPKPKRKLSAWNKFVKANSRKKEFRYRDGKLNLKKMGVAFRRKKRR